MCLPIALNPNLSSVDRGQALVEMIKVGHSLCSMTALEHYTQTAGKDHNQAQEIAMDLEALCSEVNIVLKWMLNKHARRYVLR